MTENNNKNEWLFINAIRFQQIDNDSKWWFYLILEQIYSIDLIDRIFNGKHGFHLHAMHNKKNKIIETWNIRSNIAMLACLLGRKQ